MMRFFFLSLPLLLLMTTACDPRRGLAPDEETCMSCHRGIEQVHDEIGAGSCTVCHGGNGEVFEKEVSHVPIPENWADVRGTGLPPSPEGFIKDFAPDQLDQIDPAYLRFINPGDIRVLDQTCGACHPDQASTMKNSVMTTNAGHYMPTLKLANLQEENTALYGSYTATDEDCDTSIPGTVCSITPLPPTPDDDVAAAVASGDTAAITDAAYRHYLAKNCNTCHQAGYPRNNSPGLYRSTGCTACHMVYEDSGLYRGADPTVPTGTPTHAAQHVLTTKIPSEQCAHCHFQGGRIGLLYRGIREGGFGANDTPPNAVPIPETLYGHAPGYYFTDEDSTNNVDETPPDVHYAAGMHCADCHTGSDVHGDGRIYTTAKQQVDIRCEDCHGTVRQRVAPDAEGVYRTANGRALKQLRAGDDGNVILKGILDGVDHVVQQPADLLAPGGTASDAMRAAMGVDEDGFSHTDSLKCDSCHTSYSFYCIGCHVSYDLRLSQNDYQTGRVTAGLTRGSRQTFSLDHMLLGTGVDGRLQTVSPSQQVNMTVIGASAFGADDGELLLGNRITVDGVEKTVGIYRQGPAGVNNGFAPFFQHTTSKGAYGCRACHRENDSAEELARVRGVYGFGTGEFLLPDGLGGQIDGLQFLTEDGVQITDWVHEGTGPASAEVIERAVGVLLEQGTK